MRLLRRSLTLTEIMEFESAEPADKPVPFALSAWRVSKDPDTSEVTKEKEREEFSAIPALSFGVLLDDLVNNPDDAQAIFAFFDRALVEEDRSRFRDFLTDPELYIDRATVLKVSTYLSEVHADRPTTPPVASRSTRRSAGRGSAVKRTSRSGPRKPSTT